MLTLVGALSLEGYTVYRDDVNPRAFYVLPDKHTPAVARDAQGRPLLSLIVYRRDEERLDRAAPGDDVGGGILTFTAELPAPQEELDGIRARLRRLVLGDDAGDSDADDVTVSVVPFTKGSVTIAVAGEGTGEGAGAGAEFVRSIAGEGKVSAIGQNRKAVMVKLTQSGAALISQARELTALPINVEYRLEFEHRLVGVTMTVWFRMTSTSELRKVIDDAAKYHDYGYWGYEERKRRAVTHVTETLVRSRAMGVEVVPESSAVDAESLLGLEKLGFELLNKNLEKVIDAAPPTDAQKVDEFLEEYLSSATNTLNFKLTREMVLSKDFVPSGAVAGIGEDFVTFVELRTGFFSFLEIPVRVNADFSTLPIDSVTVNVTYRRRAMVGGAAETVTEGFNFTDGAKIEKFRAFANTLSDVNYDWQAEIFYKGSPETMKVQRSGVSDRFLVASVGDLGLIHVDVGLGLVDLAKFPQAHVVLRYDSDALRRTVEAAFLLTEQKPQATWTEVIREVPARGYRYRVDWRTADGRVIEGQEQQSHAELLRVDAPARDRMNISVSATGDFKTRLSQVVATFHYEDPANDYVREQTLTFTSDTQVLSFEVELLDSERRDYSYRYTLIYKSGLVKQVPEDGSLQAGDPGFAVVGERFDLEVEIVPALLTFGEKLKIAKVDVECPDAAVESERTASFLFSAEASKPEVWRLDLREGGSARYRVEVEYFAPSGTMVRVPLGELTEKKLLLLPPPEHA